MTSAAISCGLRGGVLKLRAGYNDPHLPAGSLPTGFENPRNFRAQVRNGNTRMRELSPIPGTLLAHSVVALCAAAFVTSVHAAQAETTVREAPVERAWWAFQQRAFPLGYIPQDAQMRALRQMSEARAARASTAGRAAAE